MKDLNEKKKSLAKQIRRLSMQSWRKAHHTFKATKTSGLIMKVIQKTKEELQKTLGKDFFKEYKVLNSMY